MKSEFLSGHPGEEADTSIEYIDLYVEDISPYVLDQLPAFIVRADRVIPCRLEGNVLNIAVEDPVDAALLERIRFIAGRDVRVVVTSSSALDHAIECYYPLDEDEFDCKDE